MKVLLALALSAFGGIAAAETLQLQSGDRQRTLLELYTSEGCSSCPPAERWFSTLKTSDGLWRDYVPVALHVDYWNYIGWHDRFSQAAFSNRQRRLVSENNARTVYTPGMFAHGSEWLEWRRGKSPQQSVHQAGNLTLTIDNNGTAVRFIPAMPMTEALQVHVALLGMGITTRVKAGENRGRLLQHDFVALNVSTETLTKTANGFVAALDRAVLAKDEAEGYAIAAWVSRHDRATPIQSVGGYLPVTLSPVTESRPSSLAR